VEYSNWCRVRLKNGTTGYISGNLIVKDGAVLLAPVDYAPTTNQTPTDAGERAQHPQDSEQAISTVLETILQDLRLRETSAASTAERERVRAQIELVSQLLGHRESMSAPPEERGDSPGIKVEPANPHFSRRVGGGAGLGRLIAAESAMEVGRVDFGAART
jgi:hypothetical protein